MREVLDSVSSLGWHKNLCFGREPFDYVSFWGVSKDSRFLLLNTRHKANNIIMSPYKWYTRWNGILLFSYLSLFSHTEYMVQLISLYQHQSLHAYYFHFILVSSYLCVLMYTLVLKVCITHTQPPFRTEKHSPSIILFTWNSEYKLYPLPRFLPYIQPIHSGLYYTQFIPITYYTYY